MTIRKLVGEEVCWQIIRFTDRGSRSILKANDEVEAKRKFEAQKHGSTTRLVLQKVRVRNYELLGVPDGELAPRDSTTHVSKITAWTRGSA